MRRYLFFLILFAATLFAQGQHHVRGVHPRHEKEHPLDEAHLDTTGLIVSADRLWQGAQLPQAFTGEGVVVGVTDIGFDFTHPMFAATQIGAFWDMLSRDTTTSTLLTGRDYDTPALRQLQHSYDALEQTHGTMIMGVAVGTYDRYRGMAPDADVVVVNGVLSNNSWQLDSLQKAKLAGVNYKFDEFAYMFDYAQRQGKPCVINMSAGSRQSFGDDFDVYNQRASQLSGPGRIIVASAGNNGHDLVSIHKTTQQTTAGSKLQTGTSELCYLFFQAKGDAECQLLYSPDNGATKHPLPQELYARIDTLSDYDGTPVQYLVLQPKALKQKGFATLYAQLTGQGEATLYTQGVTFQNSGQPDGFNEATSGYGVGMPGAYDDVICVGNTHHRHDANNFRGEPITWHPHTPLGEICHYSSVGPRIDGYQKPDICAPGCYVATSVSSFCEEAHPEWVQTNDDVQRIEAQDRTYAWRVDCGTSLAAPVVTGIIALWLQADPTLTPQCIKDIFRRTARHPDPTLPYPNALYGYGEIDAYAGLLDVLGMTDIEGVSTYQPQGITFALQDHRLTLRFAVPAADVRLDVYATNGVKVFSTRMEEAVGESQVLLPQLPKGVYAVQVNACQAAAQGSTLIRIK